MKTSTTDVTDDKRLSQNSWTHLNQDELQAPRLLPEGESEGFGFAPATKTTANAVQAQTWRRH